MRSSISAQSCDSIPPAPGLMVMMAFRRSFSPESSVTVSSSETYVVGRGHFALDFLQERIALRGVFFFLGQMKIGVDIAGHGLQLRVGSENRLRRLALLHDFLGLFLVLPEIRLRDFLFQGGYGFAAAGNVKDSSARVRCACEVLPAAAVNLRSS